MLKSIQQRDLDRNRWVKITMSILLGIICLSMLTYLIPGLGSASFNNNPDAVATVNGEPITAIDVQRQLNSALHGQSVPDVLRGLYAKQVLDQLIFKRALALEADRLGIRVTNQELSDRIKQIIPIGLEWRHMAEGPLHHGSRDARRHVRARIRGLAAR